MLGELVRPTGMASRSDSHWEGVEEGVDMGGGYDTGWLRGHGNSHRAPECGLQSRRRVRSPACPSCLSCSLHRGFRQDIMQEGARMDSPGVSSIAWGRGSGS